MNINPENKLDAGTDDTIVIRYKILLDANGVDYHCSEKGKFQSTGFMFYFSDQDYEKAVKLYDSIEVEEEVIQDEYDETDLPLKRFRNDNLIYFIAFLILLISGLVNYLLYK